MTTLAKIALLGTRQAGAAPAEADASAALIAEIADVSPERALLLRAGCQAVLRMAGFSASGEGRPVTAVSRCAADDRPVCSLAAARLVHGTLRGPHRSLAGDLLTLLDDAGLRLPPASLPAMLADCPRDAQDALRPVLGERGRWLASFCDDWQWARAAPISAAYLPEDADARWEVGDAASRRALLLAARRSDPQRSRRWLEDTWDAERADDRRTLLAVFEHGLSASDEPLLERARGDRSARVRRVAAELLARIPSSALARALWDAAAPLLVHRPARDNAWSRLKSVIGTRSRTGTLVVALPERFEPGWAELGITDSAPPGLGPRAWWLAQLIARVPPTRWCERFETSAAELAAAAGDHDLGRILCDALSDATLRFGDADWALPLWRYWLRSEHTGVLVAEPLEALVPLLPPDALEVETRTLLSSAERWAGLAWKILDALPRPWSEDFSLVYLDGVRAHLAPDRRAPGSASTWRYTLDVAARAIAPGFFDTALALPDEPLLASGELRAFGHHDWKRALDSFKSIIRIRQRFAEEISR